MSSKPSLPQSLTSVQLVLTGNTDTLIAPPAKPEEQLLHFVNIDPGVMDLVHLVVHGEERVNAAMRRG
jgi:hypothetical protein